MILVWLYLALGVLATAVNLWFLALLPGDTPQTHPVSAITAGWIEAWIGAQETPTPSPEA